MRLLPAGQRKPRCWIDIHKWKKCRDEWHRFLTICLEEDNDSDQLSDPFSALKNAECIAEAIAYKLALKHIQQPTDIRRPFCFHGHRLLFRELNLLHAARKTVNDALRNPLAFSKCQHYEIQWRKVITQLPQFLRRSGFPGPSNLPGAASSYGDPLIEWAEHGNGSPSRCHP